MGRRLILDTGVLIAADRRGSAVVGVEADDDCVIAAISVAELQTGVELATESRREARAEFVAAVLERVPVEPYVATTATIHGRLLAHVHRSGVRRGAHDLIVAATAAATNRTVLHRPCGVLRGPARRRLHPRLRPRRLPKFTAAPGVSRIQRE